MIHVSIFSLKSLKDSRRVCDHYNLTLMFDLSFSSVLSYLNARSLRDNGIVVQWHALFLRAGRKEAFLKRKIAISDLTPAREFASHLAASSRPLDVSASFTVKYARRARATDLVRVFV